MRGDEITFRTTRYISTYTRACILCVWIDRDAKYTLCESRDTRMVDKENWWDICKGT